MNEPNQQATPRYLTKEEVQFIFRGIADSTLDEWRAQGLPYFKKGRVVLFPAEGVLQWGHKQTVGRAAIEGRTISPNELEQFWQHIERMVSVTVKQTLAELQHPGHLEAA